MQKIDTQGWPPAAKRARLVADSVNQAIDEKLPEREVVELAIRGLLAAVGVLEAAVAPVSEMGAQLALVQGRVQVALDLINDHTEQSHG
ncbi:hypothetical protein [Mycolicibacterium sp. XJ1819]